MERCESSDEGLDQSFNSLDAQRAACEAYVLSQTSEGWSALPDLYDDGGYSGGNTDRPGLKQLLADIAETFFAHNISLRYAKITTLDQRIEDSFITYSPSLQDPQTQNTLKQALIEVLTP